MKTLNELPPLNSAAFVRLLIEDMRKTANARDMVLEMSSWAGEVLNTGDGLFSDIIPEGKDKIVCLACAGGSVVIHGMGGARDEQEWTNEQFAVADFCDDLRCGIFRSHGDTQIPDEVQQAHDFRMTNPRDERFWDAWDNFLKAYEEYEAKHPL